MDALKPRPVVGLIVEYNPLHNGHAYHFHQAKALTGADGVIAVMSGNFLQRGEPAIVNKWARTEMALHLGVDLVLELPAAYAIQPAEWFAYGAVATLEATGVVSHLCFGSEAGTLEVLAPLAGLLAAESGELQAAVERELATGASYPAAYAAAAASTYAADTGGAGGALTAEEAQALLMQPNNSLGLHYLIAQRRLGSGMTPTTIRRHAADYRDTAPRDAAIASATAVRGLLERGGLAAAAPYVPASTADILAREFAAGCGPVTWENFSLQLFQRLLLCSPEELASHHEMTEGLEYRIKKVLPKLPEPSVSELLNALKTKRYTRTKLQRMLTHTLLQHPRSELSPDVLREGPGYLRVLGFNAKGQQLLKRMKHNAKLPLITRAAGFEHKGLELDIKAASVYANAMPGRTSGEWFKDYLTPPIKV